MAVGLLDSHGKARKLTLEDVHDNFKKYNFLIFTNMGTFDTSDFNACELESQSFLGHLQDRKVLVLIKKSPDKANLNVSYDNFDDTYLDRTQVQANDIQYIEKYVELIDNFEGTGGTGKKYSRIVNRIQVKSVRNFLNNQTPDEYVEV